MKRCLALIIVFSIGFMLFSANSISADSVGEPHVFHAGEKARASEINENFDAVYKRLNKIGSVINIDADNKRVGVGVTNPGSELDIKGTLRLSGATSGFVELAPAENAGMVTYTLPASDGADGQALITNGEGILSWGSEGGGNPSGVGSLTSINSVEAAQADLGLVIGADVQPYDAGLSDISGLAVADGNIIVGNGANWMAVSGDAARTSLGLGNVENIALSTWSGSTNITTLGTISFGKFSKLSALGPFYDSFDEPGTSGQFLSSTGDGVVWTPGYWETCGDDDICMNVEVDYVGIGTSDPEKKIHIEGDGILVRPDEEWGPGDVANFFMGDFNNYIKTENDAGMEFRTEGDFVFANGNVGIGVTGPGSDLEIKGALRLSGATSGYVEFAPVDEGENTTYTLPDRDGDNEQALTTDGHGALSWATIGDDHLTSTNNLSEIYPPTARENLGLTIGTNVQEYDSALDAFSGLVVADDNSIVGKAGKWIAESGADLKTRINLNKVENTKLSEWTGSGEITTVGTIGSGKWQGTDIAAENIVDLSASKITSDVFHNDRINWKEPGDIGSDTPAEGKFTTLSAESFEGGLVVNDSGSNVDMRVEGISDPNLFYVDAGKDRIGIGVSSPDEKLSVEGVIESTSPTGGFKFPDDTVQTTAANIDTSGNIKQLIRDFTVASGESVTAGDVVSFVDGTIQKGFLAGNNITIGPKHSFNSESNGFSVAALSSTKFVVAYMRSPHGDRSGAAVIGDISGDVITYGAEHVFNSSTTVHISVAALSTTRFVVTYRDLDVFNYGEAVIGNVSGDVITFGSEYVFNSASTWYPSTAALSSTKFVVSYQDDGNYSYGTAVIGNVSGNTITFSSEHVFSSTSIDWTSAAALSTTRFVVAYREGGITNHGVAVIGDISGDAISFGSEHVFSSSSTASLSVAALSTTKFVVAYRVFKSSTHGAAMIGDVAGDAIIYGSEYEFSSQVLFKVSTAALSPTRFVVSYSDDGNYDYGTTVIGAVSGNAITYGSDYLFNSDVTCHNFTAVLSSTKFVTAYDDDGNSLHGAASIGAVPPDNAIIGIAGKSEPGGVTWPVIIGGVSDVHSGLMPGAVYFADASGDLTTDVTDYRVGLAISSEDILLDSDRNNEDQFFGDMVFANEFRITEADQYEGLILKNHFDREIFTLSEEGALNIQGAATKPGGGSWADFSDERLMKNVANIDGRDALDKLSRLQGVAYEWINPDEHDQNERAGIVAQELETVFPGWVEEIEPVGGDKELLGEGEKAKAVSFPNDFYAYLIEAVKELKAENEAMREEIRDLRAEIRKTQPRINANRRE